MTNHPPLTPRVALGIGAHPDDTDATAAGTLAKWAAAGTDVYYLVLTDGAKGSADRTVSPDDLREKRRDEQRAAARKLGVKDVLFLDYEDGQLECSAALKRDIVRVIRQLRPEVVLTFDPTMVYHAARGFINHPDHRACGQAVLDAVYPLARDHLSFPELYHAGLEPHKVRTVLLTNFETAAYHVDITATMDLKLAALAAHDSQMSEATKAVFLADAAVAGKALGTTYAESFVRIDLSESGA